MAIRRDLRPFYGRAWRAITRPAILRREGGRFNGDTYQGAAKCSKCGWIDCLPGGRSELDIAHLVIQAPESGHEDPTNLAALCHTCHRAHDYREWAKKYRAWLMAQKEKRKVEKDAKRPLWPLLEAS